MKRYCPICDVHIAKTNWSKHVNAQHSGEDPRGSEITPITTKAHGAY
jgi:uncharacterized C2H2 Zn-finger protein